MSTTRTFTLTIDGVSGDLRIESIAGSESLRSPGRYTVSFVPVDANLRRLAIDGEKILGKPATLIMAPPDCGQRVIHAHVEEIANDGRLVHVVLATRLALLEDATDELVFVDTDPVDILRTVLKKHGISLDSKVTRKAPKRAHCVQSFETDAELVQRIADEEGYVLHWPLASADAATLLDNPSSFLPVPDQHVLEAIDGGGLVDGERLVEVRLRHAVTTARVSLADYDFEKPMLPQSVEAKAGPLPLERYDYPGGYPEPKTGADVAKLRLTQARAGDLVLEGVTTSARLAPGYVVTLEHPLRARIDGKWLILTVDHELDATSGRDVRYRARFTAVPADAGYRGAWPRHRPWSGVQSATISGPSGAEIHPDEHGRVRMHHRWDRNPAIDEKSSGPVRVVQPPTSGGMLLPRMGWEALVAFHGGDDNAPFVLGRLYNALAAPPSGLPGKKVWSSLGTATTPGGGGGNAIHMDDSAGNEGLNFVASKDFNEKTTNDKNTSITANDTWTVGAARKLSVGEVHSVSVAGAQSYSIGGMRQVNVAANKSITSGSETVMIGGLRAFSIGGDHSTSSASLVRLIGAAKAEVAIESATRAVKGMSTLLVGAAFRTTTGASQGLKVTGASTEIVAGLKSIKGTKVSWEVKGAMKHTLGAQSITCGGNRLEGFAAPLSYSVGAAGTIKGGSVVVKAKSKITIKAGGVTISITPSSITIDGDVKATVKLEDDSGTTTVG